MALMSVIPEVESLRGYGQCSGLKVVKSHVLKGHFLFTRSDTLAVGCTV